jgi:hypothetical protein
MEQLDLISDLTRDELLHNAKLYKRQEMQLEREISGLEGEIKRLRGRLNQTGLAKRIAISFIIRKGLLAEFLTWGGMKPCDTK